MTAWTTLTEKLGAVTRSLDDRTTWRASLVKAVAFDIAQHSRNRLALALVVFFIPAWIGLVKAVLPDRQVDYHSEVAKKALSVPADELITISGAINAVTLIVGFMMFAAVRRSGEFDRRLVLAGYPTSSLLVAKLAGLLLISGAVASYAAAVMTLHWDPRQVWLIGFSLFISGLTYGGMGFVLGLVLSTELSGMFVIIMVSLVEVMLQNPVTNPSSDQSVVRFVPTYGAMQAGTTAGFTDQASLGYSLLGLLWLAAFGSIAVTAFHRRTKDHARRDTEADGRATTPAVVTLTTRVDGSLEVHSTTGPVVLCSQLPRCPAGCGDEPAGPAQPGRRHQRTAAPTEPVDRPKPRGRVRTTTLDGIKAAPLVR
ncbi:ABC transporter permease [Saccharothrix deserti]|uniref:ABC transporter permease n=1 Tax=Saccharothrix deserti TaxID=2593674 RepID=UPI00131AA54E|nr:ABC transporter permease [Saccharothrix deserti]